MSNYAKLYWLTRLDAINEVFFLITLFTFLACIAIVVFSGINADFDEYKHGEELIKRKAFRKKIVGNLKWMLPVTAFTLILYALTPTTKEGIIIVAGGKTMDYVQSDTNLSKIPYQTTTIISEYLDKQIKELKEGK